MRLACLCPSDLFEYGAVFTDILRDRVDTPIEAETWKPHHGDLPPGLDFDAVIVSGSKHHVYDRQDWVGKTQDYLDTALDADIPVLGVCYGHQLLADLLGGTVDAMANSTNAERSLGRSTSHRPEGRSSSTDAGPSVRREASARREMGYRAVRLTPDGERHPLFAGMPEVFTTFQSHLDTVTALPPDAAVLAENDHGIQAFGHPRGAYGVQFHPEYSLGMAETLLAEKDMSDEQRDQIAATLTEENAAAAETARRVFDNLVRIATG